MDDLKTLENKLPSEVINSISTHYTRRHWHPFGEELLEAIYQHPNINFGSIIVSIINELNIDLDPFIVSEVLGKINFRL